MGDRGFVDEFTHVMMRQSTVPKIAASAINNFELDAYWNDESDNIAVEPEDFDDGWNNLPSLEDNLCACKPTITYDFVDTVQDSVSKTKKPTNLKPINTNLLPINIDLAQESIISPILSYNLEDVFPVSPNVCFFEKKFEEFDAKNIESADASGFIQSCCKLHRLQTNRPPDLELTNDQNDPDSTLGYIPEFSPQKSPHVPPEINESVFGENTPTPPRYKTPPRGMMLNSDEVRMFVLLKHYDLAYLTPIFLKQEVDIDLFMSLTERDLVEIGIELESDRTKVLAAITDAKDTNSLSNLM